MRSIIQILIVAGIVFGLGYIASQLGPYDLAWTYPAGAESE